MSDTPQPPPPSGPPAGGPPPGGPPPGGPPPGGPSGPPPGAPPPGGTGGPPPGGYGGFPPAGGRPPAGQEPYSIGAAFNYGWAKFQQNLGPILLGLVAYIIIVGVITFVWSLLTSAVFLPSSEDQMEALLTGEGGGFVAFASLLYFGFTAVIGFLGFVIIQAAVVRAALALTRGETIELQTLFRFDNLPQLFIGALLVGVLTGIGSILCYIPGLIVTFFTQFYVHFLIDQKISGVDAIKASFSFVNANLGTLIGFFLASLVAYIIGALLCGIGLLVALPVVFIAQAYTYQRLRGVQVAA